ncbi:MAG: AraC family transcriptional regulator [Bacteroidales bacterium]|nr:AraC family transcriptional regulator [Bacteroidales bacterium]
MKMNSDKENLLFSLIAGKIGRIRGKRKMNAEQKSRAEREMDLVETRLSRWVAEGKHRIKYGCLEDILFDLDLTSYELTLYCSTRLKKTFLCWRKELRMEEAKKMLLEHPDMPAYQVGKALGITDKSNFRHQFKSVTGLTPSQWRVKFKKE